MTARNSAVAGRFRSKTKVLTSPQFYTIFNNISFANAAPCNGSGNHLTGTDSCWTKALTGTDGVTGHVIPNQLYTMFGNTAVLHIDRPSLDASVTGEAAVDARTTAVLQTSTDTTPSAKELVMTQVVKTAASAQQTSLTIWRPATGTYPNGTQPADVGELYYRGRIKIPATIETLIANTNYYTIWEFKTGGYLGSWKGDYRFGIAINKSAGNSYYRAALDNRANGQDGTCPGVTAEYQALDPDAFTEYNAGSTTPGSSVVTGWNTLEIYIKRPTNRADIITGRTWAAITPDSTSVRTKIIDQVGGIQMGADELPMNRIILGNCYSDSTTIDATHNVTMGAIEIWDHLPAGVVAPT